MAPTRPMRARSRLAGYDPLANRLGPLQGHIGLDTGIGAVASRFPYKAPISQPWTVAP